MPHEDDAIHPLAPSADVRPTRGRLVVLAFLCGLSFVLYLDRVCMSQALKPIKTEMGLDDQQMAFVMMAFTLAYGLFEVPTGHWGDRVGPRKVLTRIVLWWSAFTALTAACVGFWSLLLVRFLFGAGEAGAYPNAARVTSRWFPPHERGRVQGLFLMPALLGGMAAPTLTAYLIEFSGWRSAFILYCLVGVAWAAAFAFWFRDDPAAHPRVNAAELRHITAGAPPAAAHAAPIPWDRVVHNSNIWLLGATTICASFMSYLYFTWYPTYLQEARNLDNIRAGWLASLVLGGGAAGVLGGGLLADALGLRGRRARWRSVFGMTAFILAAGLLIVGSRCDDPYLSAGLVAVSFLALMSQQPIWWSAAIDTSGRHVGALFGLMNGLGTIGALSSQYLFGAFTKWRKDLGFIGREQSDPVFVVYAILLLVGACCWLFVNPAQKIEDDHEDRDSQ
jgi:ACS family glucarate transporter-like MFS transporter